MRCSLSMLIVAGVVFANAGCGAREPLDRIAVRGKVTSASGGPITGMISFLPEEGTKAPAATASLINGSYRFDTHNGPVAGKYRVLVVENVADQKEKELQSPTPPKGQPATQGEWSFEADVSRANVQFDFDVPPVSNAAARK